MTDMPPSAPSAVRVGPFVHLPRIADASTADPQTRAASLLARAALLLESHGATAADVIRTRFYVDNLADAPAVRAAHAAFFGDTATPAAVVFDAGAPLALDLDAVVSGSAQQRIAA